MRIAMLNRCALRLAHVLPLALAILVSACSGDPPTGPVEIRYGRDTCAFCGMIITDPRFAAQIRGGAGHAAYKFDDIGDALLFLDRQSWKDDAGVEFWVMDAETGKTWLDARRAFYVGGMQTPMSHGFGAFAVSPANGLTFEEMRLKAAKHAANTYCQPGQRSAQHD